MEMFFNRKHRRYLQILADPRDEVQRRIVLKILAEEKAELRDAPLEERLCDTAQVATTSTASFHITAATNWKEKGGCVYQPIYERTTSKLS